MGLNTVAFFYILFESFIMTMKPPLQIYLLAHPHSPKANALAESLRTDFMEPPASGGLRIPIFLTPDQGSDLPPALHGDECLDIEAAEHSIVVILADEIMLRVVPSGTGRQWKEFTANLIAKTPLNDSPHHVLPIALDKEGFRISDTAHVLPAVIGTGPHNFSSPELQYANISFHITARAIQLLEHGKVPELAPNRMKAPVQLFISHAKADLKQNRSDPIRQTISACSDDQFSIEKWFDSANIATSQEFEKAIQAGIRDCSIMLAFYTDHYSSRPWCRKEILAAKRLGVHILAINALEEGEQRSFPYGSNIPVIRWNKSRDCGDEARRVICQATREALRYKHNRALLQGKSLSADYILAFPPEALTLTELPTSTKNILYPDPPLGREELEVLAKLKPDLTFTTPLTRHAASCKQLVGFNLNVSISESGDCRHYGLSDALFETLADELHLYLLLAGLKITYGGALSGNFKSGTNFTVRLFELVRSYSALATGINASPLNDAIVNIAPWPLRLNYGDSEWALFNGEIAKYEEGLRPSFSAKDVEIFPRENEKFNLKPDSPLKRYAWAQGLTAMRKVATEKTSARLVLGGKLTGFTGLVPGVIEEAWLSLKTKKPLYLVGAYGGAARAVCDVLLGKSREEFTLAWCEDNIPDYTSASTLIVDALPELNLLHCIGRELASMATDDLGKLFNNGLSDCENRELMKSSNPQRIAALILQGIASLI